MKYIRKNGIKDPGSAITHGIALILAAVAFEGGAGAGSSACGRNDSVYAEYDFAVSGEHRVSHV